MTAIGQAAASARQAHQAGDLRQAEHYYRFVVAEGHNQLGVVYAQMGRVADAEAQFRLAVQHWPDAAGILNNLCNVLKMQGKLDEAEDAARKALQLDPNHAIYYSALGEALRSQGKLDEALTCYRRTVQLKPDFPVAHSNLLLCLNYHPRATPEEIFAEHRRWAEVHGRAPAPPPWGNSPDPGRRLRIGYVSPDLCRHVVSCFLSPILSSHDPSQVEVFCYAEVMNPDDVTARFRKLAHGWRSTCGQSDSQVAEWIRRDGIDILVDLAGHTGSNRLGIFAHRPAPVQVTYLGYPNTTGLPAVGFFLTDAVADPVGEPSWYTEELVRLPGCFCCYAPLERAGPVAPLPARRTGHVTFGSLHDLAKVNDEVIDLWCEVLRAVPSARLLLFRHTLRGRTRDDFRRQFEVRGFGPYRVELRHETGKGPDHLDVYPDVDVLLDVFPWSGHATTCEALWMGVPVVTLAGSRHAGRLSASVLTALGLQELIAADRRQYVEIARRLAGDLDRLSELRSGLRGRMAGSPLCEGPGFTRKLEAAYRELWRRWCASPA